MLRRSSPLFVLGMIAVVSVVSSCDNLAGLQGSTGTPISIVLMNARTKGTGYTTFPRVNFYSVSQATFSFSTINSDTCLISPYDTTAASGQSAVRIGAGAYMLAAVSGDTDSLYKATTSDQTYQSTHVAGMPFHPGDSVFFNIAGDVAGFPQFSGSSRTAEPFVIATPVIPPNGQSMVISWTPATDNNAAMYVALLFNLPANNAAHGSGLNTQIFCDFHDDGQGTVQASLLSTLASSSVPFVMRAQRVRTALVLPTGGRNAYLNIISTYDVPTPVSP
jgi:hypothetical protein